MEPDLTDAQRVLVEGDGGCFSPACPGAGKTRAIASRYLQRAAEEARKGIALLSFTRVAIDEVKSRCGRPDPLAAPNFIGTFDSFINRFLSGPLYSLKFGRVPEFVDSWDRVPSTWLSDGRFKLGLEWFDFDKVGTAVFVPERVRDKYEASLVKHVQANLARVCLRAAGARRNLIEKHGVLSSSASRWFALTELGRTDNADMMGRLLGTRFAEVIVDEAQDCGSDELDILEFLSNTGVVVTLVGDRDQAIFEFRRATPNGLDAFVAKLAPGQPLDGNFRSSPAICALNDSLRAGAGTDKPVGPHADVATPVQLIEYADMADLTHRIGAVADANGVATSDLIVVAHNGSHARMASGSPALAQVGSQKIVQIAESALDMTAHTDPRYRVRAIERVERILLGRIDQSQQATVDLTCRDLGIDRRWLREAALRTIMATDPTTVDRVVYATRVRLVVDGLAYPTGVPLRPTTRYLANPNATQWAKLGGHSWTLGVALRWATIHAVKGQEFPAVVVVIPERPRKGPDGRTAIDHWQAGTDAESRRVLYVGASRAQKLVMLAVHAVHRWQVEAILQRDDVPFTTYASDAPTRRRRSARESTVE